MQKHTDGLVAAAVCAGLLLGSCGGSCGGSSTTEEVMSSASVSTSAAADEAAPTSRCEGDTVVDALGYVESYAQDARAELQSSPSWSGEVGVGWLQALATETYCAGWFDLYRTADELAERLDNASVCPEVIRLLNPAVIVADATNHMPLNDLHRLFRDDRSRFIRCEAFIDGFWLERFGTGDPVQVSSDAAAGELFDVLEAPQPPSSST